MAASDFKKLKIILGDIRQRAVRLKIDAEEPGAQEQSGRGKRLAKEFAEGGRMLLCAMGIGVFSNDTVLKKLIEDLSSSKERNLEAGCRDALAHYRLDVFLAATQHWLPQRWPAFRADLDGRYSLDAYEEYAEMLMFLADRIEEELECRENPSTCRESAASGRTRRTRKSKRKKPSQKDEADVLIKSRRKCCICYGVNRDFGEKRGQIAHLDRNPANSSAENLVWLCLEHHDQYDSPTSQSKGLTILEVREYRNVLHEAVEDLSEDGDSSGDQPGEESQTVIRFPGTSERSTEINVTGNSNIVTGGDLHCTVKLSGSEEHKASRNVVLPGTVSENPRMIGYLRYLVERFKEFKQWELDEAGIQMKHGLIYVSYKRAMKYDLKHTPETHFDAAVEYLQKRISNTKLGRIQQKKGHESFSSFETFDTQT